MVELKTPGEIDAMAAAGRVVARALEAVRAEAAVGVRLRDLDAVARAVLRDAGATSPFLNYQPRFAPTPYPGVVCLSVNDAVLHGIPTGYRLRDGDLLSVDCGATLDGWTGDSAISFCVGSGTEDDERLIERTEHALHAGIAEARDGARIGDVSAAIGAVARDAGYGLHTDFGGHGVGRTMHEDPHIPNDGRPGRGLRLQIGMTIAIEPWFLAGGQDAYRVDDDGWTLRSADGSRGAHAEHTIAVTAEGPRVLTTL
ncbi:type I methionyl aminopeptidase [Jatrophihabitans endophyticus]|uniref:type I methionyl aminopeptidase n=1 Tax=Jatrophihabitans endophyticus TaxID=1206085 RepID=UPI001A0AAD2B|nr:type I methionyl aminopeptidase [Jatrophihabitans endophyticus]MBE7188379.1 type I methionyl aminopeptidase [Jatrophihabitans endophyticus]